MLKTISSSELRTQIRRVLNEVGYGRAIYVVEKFGEPTAAIISMEDFRLLQAIRQRETAERLREVIARVRARSRDLPLEELDALIEEARADFHRRKGHRSDAD
ncbi:MAG: type II toxin-antitoxin system prevent-host-death family antitoxin [Anaerolineae bacterium]|nr:type II toxin-antitoxin system Phd/YefM family antitoxin [Anaerolineae bacterium]MCX8068081.1 type II toxin-antitoxin system Phd/YefM family antitoxin [Anaerolineae bacterium]MDW7992686.1 type II toxin-antitoxin system prevent-host-death family antitoxin [Anaerolineae bacterium]